MQKLRIGIVGIKGVGEHHLKIINNSSKAVITAICDIDKDFLDKKSKEYGIQGFFDYKQLFNKDTVDAVIICTPHNLHHEMALAFLSAGIHVLLEKPLSNTVKEADELIKTSEQMNLKLCVGHQYRTHRSSQIMKNLIDSGEIGKIMRVLWTWSSFRPEMYYEKKPWHATWKESGAGVLMNQVSHDIDLICWLIGKPLEVNAMFGNQLHNAEIEDITCVNILFENGIYGTFQFTINQPEFFSVRQIVGDKAAIVINNVKSLTDDGDDEIQLCKYRDSVVNLVKNKWNPEVVFEKEKLDPRVKKKKQKKVKLRDRVKSKITAIFNKHLENPQKPEWVQWTEPTGRTALLTNFINSITDNEPLQIDAKSTLNTVEVINAIILSAIKNKTVQLPVNRDEYQEVFSDLCLGKIKVPRYR